MLDHVALLGADTPAVDGLADIGLAGTDVDRLIELHYEATDADGWLTLGDAQGSGAGEASDAAESALEKFIAALRALFGEYSPLIYNRTGAPRVRQLFAALEADLRRVARADVPLHEEGPTMTMSLETIRGLLSLSADAEPAAYIAALNAADTETADALVTLADAMQFDSPEQLVGWLAGALAVAPGDLGGIASKVVEVMGGNAPEVTPDPNAPPDPNAAPVWSQLHDTTSLPAAGGTGTVPPQVVELSAAVAQLTAAPSSSSASSRCATPGSGWSRTPGRGGWPCQSRPVSSPPWPADRRPWPVV